MAMVGSDSEEEFYVDMYHLHACFVHYYLSSYITFLRENYLFI